MFLSVRDLFLNYGKLEVLKGVCLELTGGEISVLFGANGSGKSTLLKAISGLYPPISGSILFQGKRIDGLSPPEILKAGIAQVPEGKKIFGPMSVRENLLMGAYLRRDRAGIAKDIEEVLELFPQLRDKLKWAAATLSGGEQQKLAIARALMTRPKLLLMDEPAQGLSPVVVSEVADIVTRLNRDGVTILLVEHNLRLGLSISHKIYVLDSGKIAFEAKSGDLPGVEYAKKIYLGGT